MELDTAPPGWLLLWGYLCHAVGRLDDANTLFNRMLRHPAFMARMPEGYYYAARNAYFLNRYRSAAELARFFVEARAVSTGRIETEIEGL